MSEDVKQMLVFVIGILIFFGTLIGGSLLSDSIRHDCKVKAIEKGMSASDVQAVCNK